MSDDRPKLPRCICQVDPTVPRGAIAVGGPYVLSEPTDEELGWAVTAKYVRAHDEKTLSEFIFAATKSLGAIELKWIEPDGNITTEIVGPEDG